MGTVNILSSSKILRLLPFQTTLTGTDP